MLLDDGGCANCGALPRDHFGDELENCRDEAAMGLLSMALNLAGPGGIPVEDFATAFVAGGSSREEIERWLGDLETAGCISPALGGFFQILKPMGGAHG